MDTSIKIKNTIRKKCRLGINWGDKKIEVGQIGFIGKRDFVFSSKFHNSSKSIETGISTLINGKFINNTSTAIKVNTDKGFHLTLHSENNQVFHLHDNSTGKNLLNKKFNWYPVQKPFNLFILYTPPLDTCGISFKNSLISTNISSDYRDSVIVKVDIYPKQDTLPFIKETVIWGYCPDYLVATEYSLANQRTDAMIYWEENS